METFGDILSQFLLKTEGRARAAGGRARGRGRSGRGRGRARGRGAQKKAPEDR